MSAPPPPSSSAAAAAAPSPTAAAPSNAGAPPPLSETVLPSGTIVAVLRAGDGVHFAPMGARVRIHYTARLSADGVLSQPFDDSRARGEPLVCRVGTGQLIAGLDDALPLMSKGQLSRITVPRVPRAHFCPACACECAAIDERADAKRPLRSTLPRRPMRGYGGRGFPPIVPPEAVLVYEVDLLAIEIY